MAPRTVSIPELLTVSAGCLKSVDQLLQGSDLDLRLVCVGTGPGPSARFASRAVQTLEEGGARVVIAPDLTGRLDQAADLAARVINEEISLLVAVGGGRVIDTVKLAASRTGTPFVAIPTTIAHDGISSPVASLQPASGARQSYAAAMPAGIVVDIDVIGSAPPRTLRAGVGDLMSNLTASLDWKQAEELGLARYDAFASMIAESAAQPLFDVEDLDAESSHELIAKGLLMSGLAMAAAGTSRPCSGAEHLISHSLDQIRGSDSAMHGEQVAIGTLLAARAHGAPIRNSLMMLFRRLGLPTSPADLGLSEDEFITAIQAAPATRPERFTVLTSVLEEGWDLPALVREAFLPV